MSGRRSISVVCLTRWLLYLVCCLMLITFLPPLRNRVLFFWPRAWRPLSTHQALRMWMDTAISDGKAALSVCTEPGNFVETRRIQNSHLQSNGPSLLFEPRQGDTDTTLYAAARSWVENAGDDRPMYAAFLPLMSPADKSSLLSLWSVLHSALAERGISYFFIEGSLLGAVRHKGFIPWDDDVDVGVDLGDALHVQRVLSCLPGYALRIQANMHWKFFSDNASAVYDLPSSKSLHPRKLTESEKSEHVDSFVTESDVVQRYPFIDIFFFKNDGEYMWAATSYVTTTSLFRVEDVYPLTTAVFEGVLAPVPRRSEFILQTMYDVNSCASPTYRHRKGQPITNQTIVPCQNLSPMYSISTV